MKNRVDYYVTFVLSKQGLDCLAFCKLFDAKYFVMNNYSNEFVLIVGKDSHKRVLTYSIFIPGKGFSKVVRL